MKLSFRYKLLFLFAFISLLSGFFNYLLFQPDIMLFKILGIGTTSFGIKNNLIRHFFSGYFSDVAWCISLCCIAFALAELNYITHNGKILLLLLPFLTEGLQYYGVIKGTFDWYDILTYLIVITLFILFFPTLKTTVYEKN